MGKKKYNIIRFEAKHLKSYNHIYISAFGSKANLDIVEKKFFHKYQKIQPSFIAFSDSNEPSSFYGIITQKITYNDSVFEVGQSCDSMTHKNHGGQGLFVKVAEMAYDFLKTKSINYVYGFPNTTIYNLRKHKLNWEHLENINVYKQKINTLPIDKLVKKIPVLNYIYIKYLKNIFKQYLSKDLFFKNSVLENHVGGVLHDLDYFDYKSSKNKFILKINGINFWIKVDGILWVGDFENTSFENFNNAFDSLKKLAKKAGLSNIVFHYQEDTYNDKLLKQIMPIHSTMPVGYRHLNDEHKTKSFKYSGSDFDTW